jgi:hypothetical protein
MKLTRLKLSLLRLTDGIASTADIDRLLKHFDTEVLDSWRELSGWIADGVSDPMLGSGDNHGDNHGDNRSSVLSKIDVSEQVMEQLGLLREHKALDGKVLRSALMDSVLPDVSDRVMFQILGGNTGIEDVAQGTDEPSKNVDIHHGLDQNGIIQHGLTGTEMEDLSSEEWSLSNLLRTALSDPEPDLESIADLVGNVILSSQITDDVLEEVLKEELDAFSESSSFDALLLEGLEDELNPPEQSLESVAESMDDVSGGSLMDCEDEILSPFISHPEVQTHVGALKYTDDNMVVEFTEEEEFSSVHYATQQQDFEEDSDEELCSVAEAFVSESMLADQEIGWTSLRKSLLKGGEKDLNIWNAISKKVSRPPLRLLKDATDIEVVDKVPVSTKEEVKNFHQNNASVEFLNSKSIDADSTISKVSVTVLGSFLTLAAAWMIIVLPSLLTQTTSTINTPKRIVTFEVAEVNQLEVEDLEVGEDMSVQILQGDGNAPTIIFLDEMEEL